MADGPVANLPPGMDAYAGYTNVSGIGQTYPGVVAKYPNAKHLSITTDGVAALCADVEKGAMTEWTGYPYGYCSVNNVNSLVARFGRPKKLWTAHYDPKIGAHICSPKCWPGLVTTADGTQWVDHGGWDESLLADDFFVLNPGPFPPPLPSKEETMSTTPLPTAQFPNRVLVTAVGAGSRANQLLVFTINDPTNPQNPGYDVIDVTDGIGTPDPYTVSSA